MPSVIGGLSGLGLVSATRPYRIISGDHLPTTYTASRDTTLAIEGIEIRKTGIQPRNGDILKIANRLAPASMLQKMIRLSH
ncbi:hypothetical protein NFI95_15380 [Acetobacteraceae bacterium KSS8]|uniref:Uncharacterized protein n=1 Tax=Endosaccharibacter trunci TaxID=2812733 RepID=A0ABT1WC31_9PROT|nr:hypothetical protein [Acetobacteraceae bacterium KSS8]